MGSARPRRPLTTFASPLMEFRAAAHGTATRSQASSSAPYARRRIPASASVARLRTTVIGSVRTDPSGSPTSAVSRR